MQNEKGFDSLAIFFTPPPYTEVQDLERQPPDHTLASTIISADKSIASKKGSICTISFVCVSLPILYAKENLEHMKAGGQVSKSEIVAARGKFKKHFVSTFTTRCRVTK